MEVASAVGSVIAGFLLGYVGTVFAAGPLAALVFRASVAGQRRQVVALSVGGAVGEGIWAIVAASGLGWILTVNPAISSAFRLIGGVLALLVGVGLVVFSSNNREPTVSDSASAATVLSGFLLVALNPSFLASWLSSCAILRTSQELAFIATRQYAFLLGFGAAAGVLAWFLTLDWLLLRYRDRLQRWKLWLQRFMGVLLVIAGIFVLVR